MNYMTKEDEEIFEELSKLGIERFNEKQRLYKYVDVKTAIKILKEGSLRFSSPKLINDNDLELGLLNINLSSNQLRKQMEEGLIDSLIYKENYQAKDAIQFVKSTTGRNLIDTISQEKSKEILLDSFLSAHQNVGLFCATVCNNDKQMWYKYGNKGKGVCIEYKLPSLFTNIYFALKVFYYKEFKSFELYDSRGCINNISLYRWLFTKKDCYAFEKEIRIIMHPIEDEFCDLISKDLFTGIYYGRNTSIKDIEYLEELLIGYSFKYGKRAEY